MIVIQQALTADNTDVLTGTDLNSVPADGQLDVFAASTQADTVISITPPGSETPIRNQTLIQRTNGVPELDKDVPISVAVGQGSHCTISIDIVTGATVIVIAVFRAISELA